MPLSSDTKKVLGMCLAVHFGFTEEVNEDEDGRGDGEEGSIPKLVDYDPDADRSVDPNWETPYPSECSDPSPSQHSSEVDESVAPNWGDTNAPLYFDTYLGIAIWRDAMDESWFARPKCFDLWDYWGPRLERAVAVADAERSVCRLRFLLLQNG